MSRVPILGLLICLIQGILASKDNFEDEPYSYDGLTDANSWSKLFEGCSKYNPFQSPINIITGNAVPYSSEVVLDHPVSTFRVTQKNGLPFWNCATPGNCGSVTKDGKKFELAGFHFHTPSENAINGIFGIMDVHLVHIHTPSCDDLPPEYLVVGTMAKTTARHNENFDSFWNSTILSSDDYGVTVDPSVLYEGANEPGDRLYIFPGSLTTPPCSAGVNWLVMGNFISVSEDQANIYRELAFAVTPYGNYRPLQPMNNRKLEVFTF
mmetsp:Transcript_61/g.104  ORF Transcript_61/g.104 Transcript_61/m.104 type:complete len:266 (-) Transcript_61:70-867(-)